MTIGVSVDSQDHIWIIHRQGSLEPKEAYMTHESARLRLLPARAARSRVRSGRQSDRSTGADQGPATIGRIPITESPWTTKATSGSAATATPSRPRRKAAIRRHGPEVHQDGKFLHADRQARREQRQQRHGKLRRPGQDVLSIKTPTKLYVADGYGNHRVIVFDADTGKYQAHWGAYGHKPDDTDSAPTIPMRRPTSSSAIRCIALELANDGLLYVCDRVERPHPGLPEGRHVREGTGHREEHARRRLRVGHRLLARIRSRSTSISPTARTKRCTSCCATRLQELTSFGDGGRQPGEFYAVHSIATDSRATSTPRKPTTGSACRNSSTKAWDRSPQRKKECVWPKGGK